MVDILGVSRLIYRGMESYALVESCGRKALSFYTRDPTIVN